MDPGMPKKNGSGGSEVVGVLSLKKNDSGSEVEDDGSSSEEDDGSCSSEEDGDFSQDSSSEENNGGLSSEKDSSGTFVADHDGGFSVDNGNFSLSVGMKQQHESSLGKNLSHLPLVRCFETLTKVEKAVKALDIVRRWQFTEYDPKSGHAVPTRFCRFNTALFDFEKESTAGLGPPFRMLRLSDCMSLEVSVNFVSVKILESDVSYPISVFGTILARDQLDYKCVYLFNRPRQSPQIITSPNDMLTLTGPYRGLVATWNMSIEINLKIRCDDGDKDFSKGLIEHCGTVHTEEIVTQLLTSWMSKVQLLYTHVPSALEATISINILKGPCDFFTGKVIAWTSRNENRITLYDSEEAAMRAPIGQDGSVGLSRSLVAVPLTEELVIEIQVLGSHDEVAWFTRSLKQSCDHDFVCEEGFCELQVKVVWTSMVMSRFYEVFENVGRDMLVM